LISLIGYFIPLKEILRKDIGEDDYRSLESRIIDVCDVRNVMDHYTQKISEPNERRFAFDQMDSVSAIIRLSFYRTELLYLKKMLEEYRNHLN
jgi:hypothetical protein